ncbi:MAG: hypothetical protein RL021_172 [Bacteroidota bacterium]
MSGLPSYSQELDTAYRKNAINCNLTLTATNEVNFGIERFVAPRISIEINGGPIRSNSFLAKQSQSWTNSLYFYESGFSGRLGLKFYKKKSLLTKWQDYVSPALIYKSLAFEPQMFKNKYDVNEESEGIFLERQRSKFGFEFLWGKIYPLSKTFSLEFYYGVGLRAASVVRTDYWRIDTLPSPTNPGTDTVFLNFTDENFYIRPSIHGGLKFRFNY